ncbi:hypothetical protein [Paenibacillus sp. MMO-177]|uniref:hypothetical protein n=1 Tax=Paenibacillus sp. MMO-177 TaxID=3081289 RepID=UPI0030179E44
MPKQTLVAGEVYDLVENEDGSKRLSIEKNKAGFKININVSGCKQEHEQGINAVKDFFVKGCL